LSVADWIDFYGKLIRADWIDFQSFLISRGNWVGFVYFLISSRLDSFAEIPNSVAQTG
jgi:hypothetical protein